jgi:FG-GAP-like repeat/FG-GAP repeat
MKMRFRTFVVMTLLLPLFPLTSNAQFYRLKTFGPPQENLSAIVKADVNHDGKPDAIGLTFQSQTVYVTAVLGDGKGGFLAPKNTQITGLNNPNNLSVGDFNGDGFPDVIVSGADPVTGVASIGVMLGNGDGTFQPAVNFPSGTGDPFDLSVTGDFNGDGHIDVALIPQSGRVVVLLGKGDGTFGSPIAAGKINTRPGCIAAADFNQDGKLDLTVGTDVLLGKGDGRFQAPIAVPEGNCGVAIADLNHDGILDLITGNSPSDDHSIRVHLGNGTGKFDAGTPYHTGSAAGNVIKSADLNGDGSNDIVVLNGGGFDFTILLNKGDGTFTVGKTYNGGPGAYSFFIADLNQDKKSDLAFTVEGRMGMIPGNGDGTFQAELAQNDRFAATGVVRTFIAADVNNDHKPDLVFGDSVELGNGDGTFKSSIRFPSGCLATTVGDFNHDGNLDIAGPTFDGFHFNGVAVCLGKGNGSFGNPVVFEPGIQHEFELAGDFNNDGKLDVAASDQGGISILLGNGDGTFKSGIPTALNASFPTFVLGDFNGDGNLDVAANTGRTVSVLLGKGDGHFSAPVSTSVPAGLLYVGDMNHDGKLDLIVLSGRNTVSVWLGNGDGTFTNSSSITTPGTPESAVLGDFNLDGNLDVAVTVGPYRVDLLAGDGKGGLTSTIYLSGLGMSSIAAADFDGDGRPDLVTPSGHGSVETLVIFLNTLK